MHGLADCPRTKTGGLGFRTERRAATDVSQTYHSAVGHGALGSAGALGALPPLWLPVRRLADLEDIPGGSGAVFAPIRCRTHAYTSTNKTALIQNGLVLCTPPPKTHTHKKTPPLPRFLPRRPAPTPFCRILSPQRQFTPKFTFANYWQAWEPISVIAPSISLRFLPSSVGDGANIIPDEPQSAGKVPDERLRLPSALP